MVPPGLRDHPSPPKHVFHTGDDRQGVRTLTHRRGALEFGSAVGEVVGGCLLAHWLQLERERKNRDFFHGGLRPDLQQTPSLCQRGLTPAINSTSSADPRCPGPELDPTSVSGGAGQSPSGRAGPCVCPQACPRRTDGSQHGECVRGPGPEPPLPASLLMAGITPTPHLQLYKIVIILFTNFKCMGLVGFREILKTSKLLSLICQPQEIEVSHLSYFVCFSHRCRDLLAISHQVLF